MYRLYQLMKLIGRVTVKEFSSNLHTVRRNRILKQFAAGKIQLYVYLQCIRVELLDAAIIVFILQPCSIQQHHT